MGNGGGSHGSDRPSWRKDGKESGAGRGRKEEGEPKVTSPIKLLSDGARTDDKVTAKKMLFSSKDGSNEVEESNSGPMLVDSTGKSMKEKREKKETTGKTRSV